MYHSRMQPVDGIHSGVSYVYADAAARLAASGFAAYDLNKIALQQDTGSLWLLSGYSPIAWTPISFYSIAGNYIGTPAGNSTVFLFTFETPAKFPANLSGSIFKCGTNPSSATAITLSKNGTSFGTVSFSTGGVATISTTAQTFAAGDVLKFTAPSALNSIADLVWTIKGGF